MIITTVTRLNTKIYRLHESVSNPDSKGANLSWMPYKDLKILNKKKKSGSGIDIVFSLFIPYINNSTKYLYIMYI